MNTSTWKKLSRRLQLLEVHVIYFHIVIHLSQSQKFKHLHLKATNLLHLMTSPHTGILWPKSVLLVSLVFSPTDVSQYKVKMWLPGQMVQWLKLFLSSCHAICQFMSQNTWWKYDYQGKWFCDWSCFFHHVMPFANLWLTINGGNVTTRANSPVIEAVSLITSCLLPIYGSQYMVKMWLPGKTVLWLQLFLWSCHTFCQFMAHIVKMWPLGLAVDGWMKMLEDGSWFWETS